MKYFSLQKQTEKKRFSPPGSSASRWGDSGFTLVELLVAMAVFVVLMMFTMGSVLSILDAGRKSKYITAVMTNLNFTLEVMSREIKFGTKYYCGEESGVPFTLTANCSNGASAVSFVAADGVSTVYRLTGTQVEKSINGGTFVAATAPDIVVQKLTFFVFNSTPQSTCGGSCDYAQPRVVMVISGYAGVKPSLRSTFTVQTTMSQRTLDL
jgi:prepilin-type N-terminal cleavage/methylation domain-containing protein